MVVLDTHFFGIASRKAEDDAPLIVDPQRVLVPAFSLWPYRQA
jgi:hypothetical protein